MNFNDENQIYYQNWFIVIALSGVLAAVCASNKDKALLSTAAAAFTAGLAGELAQEETGAVSMIASDTVRYLPQAIKKEADLGPI